MNSRAHKRVTIFGHSYQYWSCLLISNQAKRADRSIPRLTVAV